MAAGWYPPVAIGVLVVDSAAPGVVHPAGAPAAAPAAPAAATAVGRLVAQVRAGLRAGHATQRVDPRVGAAVAAHVCGHSREPLSAAAYARRRLGAREGLPERSAERGELAKAQRSSRAETGTATGWAREREWSCGSEDSEGSEELGRAWVLVLVEAARVSSPLAPGAQATPGRLLPRARCGCLASPALHPPTRVSPPPGAALLNLRLRPTPLKPEQRRGAGTW